MTTTQTCSIPVFGTQPYVLTTTSGTSVIIIGANGSGKTRLGVYIESQLPHDTVQRIAAQKSLALRDDLSIISLERATRALRFGIAEGTFQHKIVQRWGNKPATHFLSDFDAL